MLGYWTMTAVGTIAQVERNNIDKSGRNPKYMYTYVMRAERTADVPEGTSLPTELSVRAKSNELQQMTGSADPFSAGDRVELSLRATGAEPTSFYVTAAKKL